MALWTYLERGGKRGVEVAHRRWGKDDVALHRAAVASHERIGNYWHMLPEYGQARKAIWEAINPMTGIRRIDEAFPEALRETTRTQEMMIKLRCGSTWQLVGSDNFDSLVGSPPVGVTFSEYAIADPRAWGYIRPILAQNGGWALFIYTPRGNNHGKTLFDFAKTEMMDGKDWFAEKMTADRSKVFSKETLEQELRELIAELGEEEGRALYQQEYMCSFEGAVFGSYYSRQMALADEEGRVTFVPYLVGHTVDTFWDLGIDDSMSIWFVQVVGNEVRFIDYYENTGFGLDHYWATMKAKGYVYGDHYMPHDAANRSVQTGKSTKQYAEGMGLRPVIVVKRAKDTQSVMAGIQAGRKVLNRCFFDRKKCARGISALEGYRAEYDEKNKRLANHPRHDWTSHAADAFRTFAVGYREPSGSRRSVGSIMDRMIFGKVM